MKKWWLYGVGMALLAMGAYLIYQKFIKAELPLVSIEGTSEAVGIYSIKFEGRFVEFNELQNYMLLKADNEETYKLFVPKYLIDERDIEVVSLKEGDEVVVKWKDEREITKVLQDYKSASKDYLNPDNSSVSFERINK